MFRRILPLLTFLALAEATTGCRALTLFGALSGSGKDDKTEDDKTADDKTEDDKASNDKDSDRNDSDSDGWDDEDD